MEIQIRRVRERGYGVYKSLDTRVMLTPGLCMYNCSVSLRCVCV